MLNWIYEKAQEKILFFSLEHYFFSFVFISSLCISSNISISNFKFQISNFIPSFFSYFFIFIFSFFLCFCK